ncbi:adenylate/guanylate cyclase domain-containing protein [Candidatus Woesearchaeota archaeon]|jgi:adenylate cyclase|nr:adenylate/guanylate cyclase domain-containing protein [Candidatus Woesearchaeota archaeon]
MKLNIKHCIGIALLCSIVLIVLFSIGFLSQIQLKLSDALYGGGDALDAIVIIEIDDSSINSIGHWPWKRSVFANLINNIEDAKVIGVDISFFESTTPDEDNRLSNAIQNVNLVLPSEFFTFEKTDDGNFVGGRLLKPIEQFSKADTGYVNVLTDFDGITRAINLDLSSDEKSFDEVLYSKFWNVELTTKQKQKRFLINYVGAPGSFKSYSAKEVLAGKIAPSAFKNKLVLIGATSTDLHDSYFVPTSKGKAMPGVEIHANILQTLITKKTLSIAPKLVIISLFTLVSILIGLAFFYLPLIWTTIISFVAIFGYLFGSIYLFKYGLVMDLVYVPLAILLTYSAETVYFYTTEKKAKLHLKDAFSKYVSPKLVHQIMQKPDILKLGGQKKEITVFFSDIRGFTTISEKLSPEKLVRVLNEYLTEMTVIVKGHEGTVDKFIGDAVMAFWGAPLEQKDHAIRACQTSLDMQFKLKELSKSWKKKGYPEIKIGIGLSTGKAVIGNMGSHSRFDYTAIGDVINLGARLESITKQYGSEIIISKDTKKEIQNKFLTRKLDLVAVKGKKKPVMIYELMCEFEKANLKQKTIVEIYEKGLDFYLNKNWKKAIKEFTYLVKKYGDSPSKVFIERCKLFIKNSPPKNWKGEWIMKSK